MNNRERELWIQNDEGLYKWFISSHRSMTRFIRENRYELDIAIKRALGEPY